MIKIALTGSIGAGKSTVAEVLRSVGAQVIDADAISRKVTEKDTLLLAHLARVFGDDIISEDGTLDRQKMAEVGFADPASYLRMNGMIQTAIKIKMLEKLKLLECCGYKAAFAEVPLLFEAGWDREFDLCWTVSAPEQLRIERVKKRSGLSEEQILARMAKQMPQEEKERRADLVIVNDGDMNALRKAVYEAAAPLLGK